ncbi:hypothetical protein GCM10009731_66310 [Streptomyces globosus]
MLGQLGGPTTILSAARKQLSWWNPRFPFVVPKPPARAARQAAQRPATGTATEFNGTSLRGGGGLNGAVERA